jgi:hypothetical protein
VQIPAVQAPVWQSDPEQQLCPLAHFAQVPPPQFKPVSSPFRTPSTHDGGLQVPAWQTPLAQSLGTRQCALSAQGAQIDPPQSVSVSKPSTTASAHVASQLPEVSTILAPVVAMPAEP